MSCRAPRESLATFRATKKVFVWLALGVVVAGCKPKESPRRPDGGMTETKAAPDWVRVASVETEPGGVRVVVDSDSWPIPINVMHRWRVRVLRETAGSTPFTPEALIVNGGMPAHGHGLPTEPSVSRYLDDGSFLVDGMRFHMGGEWEMVVRVLDGNRWHRAAFTIALESPRGDPQVGSAWSAAEVGVLQSMSLSALGGPPRDRTNRVQDDRRAVELGRSLFHDRRLSGSGTVSCATCHQESLAFTDGRTTARGLAVLDRNTPSVIGAAWQRWFYWDGRRDSLWAQALVPIEAAGEMGSSRLAAVRLIENDRSYRRDYEAVFGPLPSLKEVPMQQAGPIGPEAHREAWRSMPNRTRRSINTAFANIGKAIAAFESTLVFEPTRFDRYAHNPAEAGLMNDSEVAGLRLFIDPKNQCMRCHNGPLLTNAGFHNVGTGSSDPSSPDVGRIAGLQAVVLDEFNCRGRYSDDRNLCSELDHLAPEAHLAGAFKVPSLRGVASTAPYMHDGRFQTLREVLEFYRAPPARSSSMPHELVRLPHLTDANLDDLEAFLHTLSTPPSSEE